MSRCHGLGDLLAECKGLRRFDRLARYALGQCFPRDVFKNQISRTIGLLNDLVDDGDVGMIQRRQ